MKRPKSYDILEVDPDISIKGGGGVEIKDCNTICAKKNQKISTMPDVGQTRPCANYVMEPLTWALKEVDLVGLHRQSGIWAQEI